MNLLRKQFRYFTKNGFDSMPQPLLVIMQGGRIFALRAGFARHHQMHLIFLAQLIFPIVVRVSGSAATSALAGKQSGNSANPSMSERLPGKMQNSTGRLSTVTTTSTFKP